MYKRMNRPVIEQGFLDRMKRTVSRPHLMTYGNISGKSQFPGAVAHRLVPENMFQALG